MGLLFNCNREPSHTQHMPHPHRCATCHQQLKACPVTPTAPTVNRSPRPSALGLAGSLSGLAGSVSAVAAKDHGCLTPFGRGRSWRRVRSRVGSLASRSRTHVTATFVFERGSSRVGCTPSLPTVRMERKAMPPKPARAGVCDEVLASNRKPSSSGRLSQQASHPVRAGTVR